MNTKPIAALSVVACLCSAGAALATDEPPPSPTVTQPAPVSAPGTPAAPSAPGPAPCRDLTRPRSRVLTSSRSASRRHLVRGSASDRGCSGSKVALVSISVALKHGNRCRFMTHSARLSRGGSCNQRHWISAKGTTRWSLRLPGRIPSGSYQILTRAVDAAGNVERAHARRLALRRSH